MFFSPVIATDQKADKTSLYNFSKLKKNRKWLKVIKKLILHCAANVSICFAED